MVAAISDEPADVGGEGTMVIRVWTEPGHETPSRIRMTFAEDPSTDPITLVATDPEQAVDTVRDWLTRLAE